MVNAPVVFAVTYGRSHDIGPTNCCKTHALVERLVAAVLSRTHGPLDSAAVCNSTVAVQLADVTK